MDKKKVLFVVHQLNYGGVQKALLSALNALDYGKYDVTLYVRKARLDLLPEVNRNVRKVIVNDDAQCYYCRPYSVLLQLQEKLFSLVGNKRNANEAKNKLRNYIADQKIEYEKKKYFSDGKKYDVAVSYIQGYPAKLVANCVDANRRVMFFHGSTDETHSLHEAIFDRIDTIVGVNEGVQKALEGLYPQWKDKITYLANYVDVNEIREKSKEEVIETPAGKTVLCTCGRLAPVKGLDVAIKAANILKDSSEQFVWYFVGDGPERGRLEDMIREYRLDEYIVIIGMQANPYPLINACEIYVQPSYEEAHPLSIIEAQILCKPVVSTATLGGKVLVQDGVNGFISDIEEGALAERIKELIHAPLTREKIKANLEQVDYSKSFERYKKKWEELLEG